MPAPQLDLVIVSYATRGHLLSLLDALAMHRQSLPLRVVVVDNASPDDSASAVAAVHSWVQLIANEQNVGFARAVNQGLALTTAPQVLLLNPDARVSVDALQAMQHYQQRHPHVGVLGPRLEDESGAAQPAAFKDLWPWDLYAELARFPRAFQPHAQRAWRRIVVPDGSEPVAVDAVMGAAMMLSRACLQAVPTFDERFFLYAEELDYCRRVRLAGFEVHHLPGVLLQHVGGASAARMPSRTMAWRLASSLAYLRKHGGWWAEAQGRLALLAAGWQNRAMAHLLAWRARLPEEELQALQENARLMRLVGALRRLPPELAPPMGAGA